MPYQFEGSISPDDLVGMDFRVPDHWTKYDLSEDSLTELRSSVLSAAAQGGASQYQDALNNAFTQMGQMAREIKSSGLLSAAGTFEPLEDGVFMATVCAFAFRAPRHQELDPIRLLENIHPASSTADEGTWMQKSLVELPSSGADLCARLYGVADYALTETETFRNVLMHTVFRVPGLEERVLISCSSPNVEHQDEILDLFDAITGTAWFWKREPQPAP